MIDPARLFGLEHVEWNTITFSTSVDHIPLSRKEAREMIKAAGSKPQRVYRSPFDPSWAAGFYWVVAGGVITVERHRGYK